MSNFRVPLLLMLLLLPIFGANCELTESVIFQPVDEIQTSKSSWIFSTAVDFTPYLRSLNSIYEYGTKVKETVVDFKTTFHNQHERYTFLLNMTIDDLNLALGEIVNMQTEASNWIDHISNRNKRSLLPFGGLFSFIFGTASEDDLNSIKADVKQLYQNQMDQTNVLNDTISITNVSRGLINENIKKINGIIDTFVTLNHTIENIAGHLGPLYTTRKFMFMHTEFISHHTRIRMVTRQVADDINLIKSYLSAFTTGKLTPQIIDPKHLRHELLKIHKQLPAKITLPENPAANIWHYYEFLTATQVIDGTQFILMIRNPLLDTDSAMTLYNPNMIYTREDTIRPGRGSELGHKTVGFQDPVSDMDQVVDVRMQHAFTKAVLDQLEANGANVRRHHRKLSKKQYAAVPAIEY